MTHDDAQDPPRDPKNPGDAVDEDVPEPEPSTDGEDGEPNDPSPGDDGDASAPDDASDPEDGDDASLTTASPRSAGLRSVLLYSVLAGLCPLVPIPFLDDVLVNWMRRVMISELLSTYELAATSDQKKALRERKANRLLGCLMLVVVYPFKKIFRKVFYFLAIKEAVDIASKVLHEGLLVRIALQRGEIDGGSVESRSVEDFRLVRRAVLATLDEYDTSPIMQAIKRVFKGSKVLVDQVKSNVGRTTGRLDPDDPDSATAAAIKTLAETEDSALGSLMDRLTEAIWAKKGYLIDLEEAFVAKLEAEKSAAAK